MSSVLAPPSHHRRAEKQNPLIPRAPKIRLPADTTRQPMRPLPLHPPATAHAPVLRRPFASAALLALAALLAAPLRADVIIDNSPAATHGTAGSHTVTGADATFTVPEGTDLNADSALADLIVGFNATGALTVSDRATVAAGTTYLGYAADSAGTLTLNSGASLSTDWLSNGYHPTASGTLLVTGTGSSLVTGGFDLGAFGGPSSVTITAGGSLTSSGDSWLERGTLTVSAAGTLTTGGDIYSRLTVSTDGIASYFTDAGLTPPAASTAAVVVTGTGSSWQNQGTIDLCAGQAADTVSLLVTDRASLSTQQLSVGTDTTFTASAGAQATMANTSYGAATVSGDVLVTGAGTTLALSSTYSSGYYYSLQIDAAGTFAVADGATVTVTGDVINADGAVSLTGAGTTLTATASGSTHAFNHTLTIADGARFTTDRPVNLLGTTTLSGGGTLASTFSSSTSTAVNLIKGDTTVTGAGSSLSFAKTLRIGSTGIGTLTIADGATVTSAGTTVGYGTSSSATTINYAGHVLVTGTGSTWNNTGTLIVGQYRHADLTVSAGGVLTNTGNLAIGGLSSSNNPLTATVAVTGAGSQLNTTGTLTVGSGTYATGRLTLADHGLATAASTLVNNGDTLTLGSFGTLDTAALTVNSGGTVLAHDAAVFAFDLGAPSLTAPLAFGAGSTFTADTDATIYLLLHATSGFGAGTYSLFSFDPTATLTGLSASSFAVATDFGGYTYTLDLTADTLDLTVAASSLAGSYAVAGLTSAVSPPSAVPEPSTYAALAGLAALGGAAHRRRRRPR